MSLPPSSEKVRPRIDRQLYGQAEQAAKKRGMLVGDYLELLIKMDGDAAAQRAQKLAAAKGDRAVERGAALAANLDSLANQFRHAVETLRKDVPQALEAGFAGMKAHISNTGGTAHLRDMIKEFEGRFQARMTALEGKVLKDVSQGLEAMQSDLKGIRTELSRDRAKRLAGLHWMGLGAALGIAVLGLLAFLAADTAPTRWLAVRFAGATYPIHAASNLLMEDEPSRSVMAGTFVLMGQKAFRDDYTACLRRYQRSPESITCKLSLTHSGTRP